MCCKCYHTIFSTFSLKFKCKICVQKEVIHNFKNHILVTWPATNLLIFKKMVQVWKTKSLLFCLRYDPLIIFSGQNHITFIFIKMMSPDLLAQMAYFHNKSKKVCIKIRATSASHSLVGQGTKSTTVKWSIVRTSEQIILHKPLSVPFLSNWVV